MLKPSPTWNMSVCQRAFDEGLSQPARPGSDTVASSCQWGLTVCVKEGIVHKAKQIFPG